MLRDLVSVRPATGTVAGGRLHPAGCACADTAAHGVEVEYDLYVLDISYFSGKLEAYLRYRGIPHCRHEPTLRELEELSSTHTGTMQVPLLYHRKSRTWLRDTTSIMEFLEKELSSRPEAGQCAPVLPPCPVQRYVSFLLEDLADEYMWRPAMYLRWRPDFDSESMARRWTFEFARATSSALAAVLPTRVFSAILRARQRLYSWYGEGVEMDEQHAAVMRQYTHVMAALEGIFTHEDSTHPRRFLLADVPTLVDFGFCGPFFRHFASDPTPRKIMQQHAPAVFEWVGALWNAHQSCAGRAAGGGATGAWGLPPAGELPPGWQALWPALREYLRYLHANAVAWQQGRTSFVVELGIEPAVACEVQVVPFRVWCRLRLQQRMAQLQRDDADGAGRVQGVLERAGLWDLLWMDGMVAIAPELGIDPPGCAAPLARATFLRDSPKWPLAPLVRRWLGALFLRAVLCGAACVAVAWGVLLGVRRVLQR